MDDYETTDLVCLHLGGVGRPDGTAPYGASVPGIVEAVGTGAETVAERIAIMSAIASLQDEGLVTESVRPVEGLDGERNVYALTDAGRERERRLREGLADAEVTVDGEDGRTTRRLSAVADRFDGSLARTLARVDGDGVLRPEGESTPDGFVDRDRETDRLTELLDPVEGGAGRTAVVTGEAGIGKTELVGELAGAARDRGFDVLAGQGRRSSTGAYAVVREALADAGLADRFDRAIDEAAGASVDDADSLSAQRTVLFNAVADQFRVAADDGPLLVFLDDLQWVDSTTVELLAHLAGRVDSSPVLFVLAYDAGPVGEDHPLSTRLPEGAVDCGVELGPLDRTATDEYLRWLLDDPAVPSAFADLVYEHTGGNPLFVESTVRRLRETGAIDPELDVYPTDPEEMTVPDRARTVVGRRVDGLDDDATAALEVAAVAGRELPFGLLAAAVEMPEPDLRDAVDLLVDSGLLERGKSRATEGDHERLRIRGELIREAVLDRLDPDRTRRLHERVAEALPEVESEDDRRQAMVVASHYERADRPERALERYREAGRRARSVYAHETAVEAFENAAVLARDCGADDALLSVLEELGDTYTALGRYDEADRSYRYVRERTDDVETERRTYRKYGRSMQYRGEFDAALEAAEAGLSVGADPETAVENGDLEVAKLLNLRGAGLLGNGEFRAALSAFDRACDLADLADSAELRAQALANGGYLRAELGEIDEGERDLERAVEAAETAGDPQTKAGALNNLGLLANKRGDLEAALDYYERSLSIQESIGNAFEMTTLRINLGEAAIARGEDERALEYHREALETARRTGSRRDEALVVGNIGLIRRKRGEFDRARTRLEEALSIAEGIDQPQRIAWANNALARVAMHTGGYDRARERAEEGLSVAREIDHAKEQARALRWLGILDRREGDPEGAAERHREALEVAREAEPAIAVKARAALVLDLVAAGRAEEAVDHARRAVETAREAGDPQIGIGAGRAAGAAFRATGDYEAAADHLQRSLDRARDLGAPVERAWTRYQLAMLAGERGREKRRREHAREAREIAEEIGLVPARRLAEDLTADA